VTNTNSLSEREEDISLSNARNVTTKLKEGDVNESERS